MQHSYRWLVKVVFAVGGISAFRPHWLRLESVPVLAAVTFIDIVHVMDDCITVTIGWTEYGRLRQTTIKGLGLYEKREVRIARLWVLVSFGLTENDEKGYRRSETHPISQRRRLLFGQM